MGVRRRFAHAALPVIKGENLKSTLSNYTGNSPSNKRANSNDVAEAAEAAEANLKSMVSSGSSANFNKGISSGVSLPPNETGPGSSNDIKVDGANSQMLEIKGSDGDKIMILQFDNRQLQVFNEILEKQM